MLLANVSLEFKDNRIYGILGENGAGKTTLFRTLLGLIQFSGTMEIDNILIDFISPRDYLKKIGIVTPFPDSFEKYTIEEIFEEHLYYMRGETPQRLLKELERVGLCKATSAMISELSLGMKQKLSIALALSHHPDLLILDEPFNGLDRTGISMLKDLLREFLSEGKIVLISSHSFGELDDLIDGVVIIKNGEVLSQISLEIIKNQGISNIEDYYQMIQEEV